MCSILAHTNDRSKGSTMPDRRGSTRHLALDRRLRPYLQWCLLRRHAGTWSGGTAHKNMFRMTVRPGVQLLGRSIPEPQTDAFGRTDSGVYSDATQVRLVFSDGVYDTRGSTPRKTFIDNRCVSRANARLWISSCREDPYGERRRLCVSGSVSAWCVQHRLVRVL
jgi:hypothetical protein